MYAVSIKIQIQISSLYSLLFTCLLRNPQGHKAQMAYSEMIRREFFLFF